MKSSMEKTGMLLLLMHLLSIIATLMLRLCYRRINIGLEESV